MPRTFKATKKRYIDNNLVYVGQIFTTNAFDHEDAVVPDSLEEVGAAPAPDDSSETNDEDKSLSELTVPELKAIAKEERIDNVSRMNKEDLIMAIESMREQNAKLSDTSTNEGTGLAVPMKSIQDVPIA